MRPVSIVQALLLFVLAVPANAQIAGPEISQAESAAKAYLISEISPRDQAAYRAYLRAVLPIMQKFGGKVLVSPFDSSMVVEGRGLEGRLAVIEFPSIEARDAFWNSAEYRAVKHLRVEHSVSRIIHAGG